MLVVAVLNGYSSSSRKTKTSALVENELRSVQHAYISDRSSILNSQASRFKNYIEHYNNKTNRLLCVGKSFGARNMIRKILNHIDDLKYYKSALLTIDPCWPTWNDWTPNLNNKSIRLKSNIGKAINLYAICDKDVQCGCKVKYSGDIKNIQVFNVDHYLIVNSIHTTKALHELIYYVLE